MKPATVIHFPKGSSPEIAAPNPALKVDQVTMPQQNGRVGHALPHFEIKVTGEGGDMSGVTTEWRLLKGEGKLDALPSTGTKGESVAELTPTAEGPFLVVCRVGGPGGPKVRFGGNIAPEPEKVATPAEPEAAAVPPAFVCAEATPVAPHHGRSVWLNLLGVAFIAGSLLFVGRLATAGLGHTAGSRQQQVTDVADARPQTLASVSANCGKMEVIEKDGHVSLVCSVAE